MNDCAVNFLTVKRTIPLYKNGEPANAVELLEFNEVGFNVVSKKGVYFQGSEVVYIQPDYCLPAPNYNYTTDVDIFREFTEPLGDAKKSKLGKNNRIRAIKFNLSISKDSNEPVYSEGICFPKKIVENSFNQSCLLKFTAKNIESFYNITKYEEPEVTQSSKNGKYNSSVPFPSSMYKTNEENFKNIQNKLEFPIILSGTKKVDGSSITIYYKNENDFGICSRNFKKPLFVNKVTGFKKKNIFHRIMSLFGIKYDLRIFETVKCDSEFIKYGEPYLNKLKEYCQKNNLSLSLRGELNGQNMKGSGNSKNPDSKNPVNIQFFNIDIILDNRAEKTNIEDFTFYANELGLNTVESYFSEEFNSIEEIKEKCNNIFKENMIEGIVLKTLDSKFSCKYMNSEYDSKK